MTPEEKAKELFNIYTLETGNETFAKNCAFVSVNEILKIVNIWSALNIQKSSQVIYWEKVKEELEKYDT